MKDGTTTGPGSPPGTKKTGRASRNRAKAGLGIGVLSVFGLLGACSGQEGGSEPTGTDAPTDQSPFAKVRERVTPSPGAKDFITFESGPVRPLAKSPDGTKLFATNTPDNRLEIFTIDANGNLTSSGSVRVGLEPVAVAARSNTEVWVVNHLSDSVSIVDVSSSPPRVTKTLLVGDEPRDIVFAANGRAFITTAHRGQNRTLVAANKFTTGTNDPRLTTQSVPRADVWVFDPAALGATLGGDPLQVVELFGDTPRALAVSGNTVYAAIFNSGNQTTTLQEGLVCRTPGNTPCTVEGFEYPGGDWGPTTNYAGAHAPHVGLMVKYDNATSTWKDLVGRDWTSAVRFSLPDKDVFTIDAGTLTETGNYQHVGTTLFNMAVNPVTGKVYVSNTDSQNQNRFEGPGVFGGQTVQGNLARARITVLSAGTVTPRHLNKHINYAIRPAPAGTKNSSLATPLEMAVTSNGSTLYVAAFGSSKVGVYDTTSLENDTFDPTVVAPNHIPVTGGGPAGVVLNEAASKLYVLTRFDNAISVVNTATHAETAHLKMFNPEPARVVQGRPFLYDAFNTSSNGETSCASCHIFGDKDDISWDLGNPDADVQTTQFEIHLKAAFDNRSTFGQLAPDLSDLFALSNDINGTGNLADLHPMKGPMSTQTFRGMVQNGAMHWRGDRSKGFFGEDTHKSPPFDSRLAFKNFIVAFPGLVGNNSVIDTNDMNKFADFALEMMMPPNPNRALDNSLTAAQYRGFRFYMGCDGADSLLYLPAVCSNDKPVGKGHFADGAYLFGIGERCEGCHTLQPENGFFGTDGRMAFTLLPQITKVPQLRNVYTKVGMFGDAAHIAGNPFDNGFKGDQVRGFGFMSGGAMDTLLRFFNGKVFNKRGPNGAVGFSASDPQAQRSDVVEFVMAFPTDMAPVVGQQITLTSTNSGVAGPRIDLLKARANTAFTSKVMGTGINECELVASGSLGGVAKNWLWRPASSTFEPDDGTAGISDATLRGYAATAGQEITFTCVPPGSGVRVALDRDRDGFVNGVDACPADAGCSTVCTGGTLDCDQAPNTCQTYTATNSNHYNAGRATRQWQILSYAYYAKGSGQSLGSGSTTTTIHSSDGAYYTTGACPTWVACEVNGNTDMNNCGACGAVCNYANATESCVSGQCVFGSCNSGYTDCNGSLTDGCEANLQSDVNNCGTCGQTCTAPHAANTCSAGTCQMGACNTGYANCNNSATDGCEIDTTTDPNHCGNCTTACSYANAGADCVASACQMGACLDGFADCNAQASDGCEVNLQTNAANCGACGTSCTYTNATGSCNAGVCQIGACNTGWSNCDGNLANGCETLGACGGGLVSFTYTPSNFDPNDPNLAPGVTPNTTLLNCGVSTFNSQTLAFGNWCGQATPQPLTHTQSDGSTVVILPMKGLAVSAGSTLQISGNRAVILAVYGSASIDGIVDASAVLNAAGPGGNLSCSGATGENGNAAVAFMDGAPGGGGGAFGNNGGSSPAKYVGGSSGGTAIGNVSLVPLRGGCAGGRGGQGDWTDGGGREGGAGGGAIQISVASLLSVTGRVSAAGGGGIKGNRAQDGGGGGGSGGGILLEGYDVNMSSTGWITANGGSAASGVDGGTSSQASNGLDGNKTSTAITPGGVPPGGGGGPGGNGAGNPGGATAGGFGGSYADGAGGGGGGAGRIRVNAYGTCSLSAGFSPAASKSGCL